MVHGHCITAKTLQGSVKIKIMKVKYLCVLESSDGVSKRTCFWGIAAEVRKWVPF